MAAAVWYTMDEAYSGRATLPCGCEISIKSPHQIRIYCPAAEAVYEMVDPLTAFVKRDLAARYAMAASDAALKKHIAKGIARRRKGEKYVAPDVEQTVMV